LPEPAPAALPDITEFAMPTRVSPVMMLLMNASDRVAAAEQRQRR
jgi:hypothetical protein